MNFSCNQSITTVGRSASTLILFETSNSWFSIPVVAASGAGSLEHIVKLAREAQPDALALASILHYDHCNISAVKAELSAKSLSE